MKNNKEIQTLNLLISIEKNLNKRRMYQEILNRVISQKIK